MMTFLLSLLSFASVISFGYIFSSFSSNSLSLSEKPLTVISPSGIQRPTSAGIQPAVLQASTSVKSLVINSNVRINGLLNFSGNALTISVPVSLDQDLSTSSTPTFAGLNIPNLSLSSVTLSDTTNQLVFGSDITGTLTWTPTSTDKTITLPDVTTTLVGIDNTQTLTNKTISGSSNTFSNIANSALSNSKVTINTSTGLSGGGDVSLGGSLTLSSSLDTSSFATLTGTQTLTNKTLTTPTLTSPTLTGGTINNTVIGGTTKAAGTFTALTVDSCTGCSGGGGLGYTITMMSGAGSPADSTTYYLSTSFSDTTAGSARTRFYIAKAGTITKIYGTVTVDFGFLI